MLLLLPLIPSVTAVGKMITVWQIVQRCYNNLDPGFYLLPPCSNRPLPVRKRRERPFLLQRATYVMKRGTSAQIVKVIQRVYILGIGRVLLELRVDLYWFRVIYIFFLFFSIRGLLHFKLVTDVGSVTSYVSISCLLLMMGTSVLFFHFNKSAL